LFHPPAFHPSRLLVAIVSLTALWSVGCHPDDRGLGRPMPSPSTDGPPVPPAGTLPAGPSTVSTPVLDAAAADSRRTPGPDAAGAAALRPDAAASTDTAAAVPDPAPPPPSAALAQGLLLFLPFERLAGEVSDHSGRNGTVSLVDFGASTFFGAGHPGEAIVLGGGTAGGYVRVDSPDFNSVSTALTISAWIRQASPSSPDGVILSRFSNSQKGDAYSLRISQNCLRGLINAVNGYHADLSAPMAVAFDVWTHVAMTYDSHDVRLYIAGTQVATAPYLLGIAPDLTPVLVGASGAVGSVGDRLPAALDDVALYAGALIPADIAALARGVRPLVR
jgi:hypothetical protein